MSYVLFRSLQILALISVLSGLYIGVRDRNLILEVQALAGGAAVHRGEGGKCREAQEKYKSGLHD